MPCHPLRPLARRALSAHHPPSLIATNPTWRPPLPSTNTSSQNPTAGTSNTPHPPHTQSVSTCLPNRLQPKDLISRQRPRLACHDAIPRSSNLAKEEGV